MSQPFEGVRVVEVAAWTFVPGAGAIMADLGADVIKVEPPAGDPQRGLRNSMNADDSGPNPFLEIPNRGKRSITLDLASEQGIAVLKRLIESADVFLTSYLPAVRTKLGIDVDDLKAVNDKLIYVRGSGWGSRGKRSAEGGFDAAAAWSAAGTQYKLTAPGVEEPVMQPAAFFDLQGSNSIAGAVAMALFRRERTGEGALIDVSLLNTGMWAMGPDITASSASAEIPRQNRRAAFNPIVNYYQTKDDRWINLVCLQADRFWPELCSLIERPDLVEDPRFVDAPNRFLNRVACVNELDTTFKSRTLGEWQDILSDFTGVWAVAANFSEIRDSDQVVANGYLPELLASDGTPFRLVAPPYQFDNAFTTPRGPAPEVGQHTEELMLESGYSWEEISECRDRGALG